MTKPFRRRKLVKTSRVLTGPYAGMNEEDP